MLTWFQDLFGAKKAVDANNPLPVTDALVGTLRDLISGAVAASIARITSEPATNAITAVGAANALVWRLTARGTFALTLTTLAGASAAWLATLVFEQSVDGAVWTTLNATPQMGLAGRTLTNTTTAPGLWLFNTDPNATYFRVYSTVYTSGTIVAHVASWDRPGARIHLPWTWSTTINTDLLGWIALDEISEIEVRLSALATAVLTPQVTDDIAAGTIDTMVSVDATSSITAGGPNTITAAGRYKLLNTGSKAARIRLTTGGGTVTVVSIIAVRGVPTSSSAYASSIFANLAGNNTFNWNQFVGQTPSNVLEQGQTTGPLLPTYLPAAATSGNLTEVSSSARTTTGNSGTITTKVGAAIAAAIVVTAASGTTPTLDLYLEESPDNGTTWRTIWMCERLTAAGTVTVPPIAVNGRRRWSWTISGTTPSFTFSVVTMGLALAPPQCRQFYDRTAGLLSGTASAVSAWFPLDGCSTFSARFDAGAITTTPGTYQIQVADDTSSPSTVTSAGAITASTVTTITATGLAARFGRLICTGAASGQTGNKVSFGAR